jgi:hypothetical protein
MLKKIIFGSLISLLSVNAFAGDYDGVWMFEGEASYYTVYQKDNQILFVQLNQSLDGWDAAMGELSANTAHMRTIINKLDKIIESNLTFTSPTIATQTIISCSGTQCDDAPGSQYTMHKVF